MMKWIVSGDVLIAFLSQVEAETHEAAVEKARSMSPKELGVDLTASTCVSIFVEDVYEDED